VNRQPSIIRDIVFGHNYEHGGRQSYKSRCLNSQFLATLDIFTVIFGEVGVFYEETAIGRMRKTKIGSAHYTSLIVPSQASLSGFVNSSQASFLVVGTGQIEHDDITYKERRSRNHKQGSSLIKSAATAAFIDSLFYWLFSGIQGRDPAKSALPL